MFVFPPTNHLVSWNSELCTSLKSSIHEIFSFARSPKNFSGFSIDSLYRLKYSSKSFICGFENPGLGL